MNACSGAADVLLLCTLLWPLVIHLYTYTFSISASLVFAQVEKEPITTSACKAQQPDRWPWGSWWTSPVCRKWWGRICSFPQSTVFQPGERKREQREGGERRCEVEPVFPSFCRWQLSTYPLCSIFQFCAILYHSGLLALQGDKEQIPGWNQNCSENTLVWQYLEQWWEFKQRVWPCPRNQN